MTPREADVLAAIQRLIGLNGYPPTIREIMAETGIKSSSHASYHLTGLQLAGVISRGRGARTIRILKAVA